jgi:acetyl esterase/lipase
MSVPAQAKPIIHDAYRLDRIAMGLTRAVLALLPAMSIDAAGRTAFDRLTRRIPASAGVAYEPATMGGIGGWWCRPARAMDGAAVLYLHGGAYVSGSALGYRNFAGQVAARAGAAVFVADYSLAPELPFPAAIEDAAAAYRALAGAGFARLAIAGDSAGGGLALGVASQLTQQARHGALPPPSAIAAFSPWTDLTLSGDSITARVAHDPLLKRHDLETARDLYLAGADATDPRASPLFGDLTCLPPTLLHVGEDEILLDDSRRFAELAAQSGSSAELHVWQGMTHVFPANITVLRAAREALDITGEFLRRNLAAHPATRPA